jgi:hypothetical protein
MRLQWVRGPRRLILALLISITPSLARAQIGGSSFNLSSLCVNPAASTQREFGHFSLAYEYKNSKSNVTQDVTGLTANLPWKESLSVNDGQAIFTHVGKVATFEFFGSYDTVKKITSIDNTANGGENQVSIDRASFINNMANMGIKVTKRISIGVKYFAPTFKFKYDHSYTFNNQTTKDKADQDGKFVGVGGGAMYRFDNGMTIAPYIISTTQTIEGSSSSTTAGGQVTKTPPATTNFATKGIGLGYLKGSLRKEGKRFEVGYSRMDAYQANQKSAGEQIYGTGELSIKGISFGGSLRLVRNAYVDTMRLVEMFIDPPIVENSYKPRFDYFISLSSAKGHSFGLSGSYTSSEGPKNFQGQQQQATTTAYTVNASYGYLF